MDESLSRLLINISRVVIFEANRNDNGMSCINFGNLSCLYWRWVDQVDIKGILNLQHISTIFNKSEQ